MAPCRQSTASSAPLRRAGGPAVPGLRLLRRFSAFAGIGASGLVLNTALFVALTAVTGIPYLAASLVAMELATCWNFLLCERCLFAPSRKPGTCVARAASFFVAANATFALGGPVLVILRTGLGLPAVLANALSIASMLLLRFALAERFTWAERPQSQLRLVADEAPRGAVA